MKSNEVLLIGARGYIGSRVWRHLVQANWKVTALDQRPPLGALSAKGLIQNQSPLSSQSDQPSLQSNFYVQDYRSLNGIDLAPYQTIIWLAGHSSVAMATQDPAGAFENNVSGLLRLVQQLKADQRLIYASSASLYCGNEALDTTTEETIGFQYQNAYDLSKFAFDKLISNIGHNFCGLRFGTVCGISPNQRDELLLNSMVRSAVTTGTVKVSNPKAKRSVLAMDDLLTCIERLLKIVPPSGFYNLASYSMSIEEFGQAVAQQLGAKIIEQEGTGTYSFSVQSHKICQALNYSLNTPIACLIKELATFYRSHHEQHLIHA